MELFSKGHGTNWLRTSEQSLGTNYLEQSQSWSLKTLKNSARGWLCCKKKLRLATPDLGYIYRNMNLFFQERPNGPFIPNLSHFPTAVWRGYKPIFLHKVVGGYQQKSCKLCHRYWFTYVYDEEIIDVINYNVIWTDNGSMLPEANTRRQEGNYPIDVWPGVWRYTHAKLAPLTPHPLARDRRYGPALGQRGKNVERFTILRVVLAQGPC